MIIKRIYSFTYFIILLLLFSNNAFAIEVISNNKIWEGQKYAAFTSLVFYKGYFYCAFRNANKHYDTTGEDCGIIKIIRSKDADKWVEFLTFEEKNYDLRDPQLSITPDNKIMLLAEKVQYKEGKAVYRQSCTSFINKRGKHTPLEPVHFSPEMNWNWIWNVEWIDNIAYGFTYVPYFAFVKSIDGQTYNIVQNITLSNSPTEASIIKWKDGIYSAVVRTNKNALVGFYNVNNNLWEWKDAGAMIGCPKMIIIEKDLFILGRSYGTSKTTAIYKYDIENSLVNKIIDLGSDKDCAYPGVVFKKGVLYVSYYVGDGVKGDVYLAKIRI